VLAKLVEHSEAHNSSAVENAPLMQSCLFQTGSIALPASRELHFIALCEHLHQNLFWACISRIHAQVPIEDVPRRYQRSDEVPDSAKVKGPASYFPSIENTANRSHIGRMFSRRLARTSVWSGVNLLKCDHQVGHGHANALVDFFLAKKSSST
jgi:hypothetical protein